MASRGTSAGRSVAGTAGYGQFCPVAMAAEVLCTRWTVPLLRELLAGSRRFNDLRRGLPRMSPALLSKRLGELEAAGILHREGGAGPAYALTEAGAELAPVVEAMGRWGQRWIDSQLSPERLDATLLMWDMRRNLDPAPLPAGRVTIAIRYPDAPRGQQDWWLVIEDGAVDLCSVDPGFDVDLWAESDLRTMTAIWMGLEEVAFAREAGRLSLEGDRRLAARMQRWLGLSPFASERKRV